jgi:hypothetical protein
LQHRGAVFAVGVFLHLRINHAIIIGTLPNNCFV